MRLLQIRFHHVVLKNLTCKEALFYICMIMAAKEGEEKLTWDNHLSKTTNGNPLLLQCYEHASLKGLNMGHQLVKGEMRSIMVKLIETMKDEMYHDTIENCHTWLLYAEQEYPILLSAKETYMTS